MVVWHDVMQDLDSLNLLKWQVEMGAVEAIDLVPTTRFAESGKANADVHKAAEPKPASRQQPVGTRPRKANAAPATSQAIEDARKASERAGTLAELRSAISRFEHCDLRKGATNLVFSDGNPNAQVMIVGEAPGREEDLHGHPFVGPSGQLLDLMFSRIGLSRRAENPEKAIYIVNVMPWQPPGNRDPTPSEIAMMRPFVIRHISLVTPLVLVLMGNPACSAILGKTGITMLRGKLTTHEGNKILPMFHPAYLLRRPIAKRESWADLRLLKHTIEKLRNE